MATGRRSTWSLVLIGLLIVAGLLLAWSALFNAWMSSGPPTPRPAWHRMWAARYFYATCACFAAALYLGVRRWRARRAG